MGSEGRPFQLAQTRGPGGDAIAGTGKRMVADEDNTSKAVFRKVNADDTFAHLIGMELVEVAPGFARSRLPVTDQKVNLYQMAHGGAIFSVSDQACEAAGNSFGDPAVALQHTIHFLAPGRSGDVLEATAKVTHRSNRIGLIEFEVRNHEGSLLAMGQQTIYFKKS